LKIKPPIAYTNREEVNCN
jgi:hypothetical protein